MQNGYRLSIITVNYNGCDDTCALLATIPQRPDIEVIVVDNGSRIDEGLLIHSRYPSVTVIRSEENLGFAGGNNLGIQAAHGNYLFFINNDTEFRGEWQVESLIRRFESDEHIGMVCPKIRFAWDDAPIQFAGFTPLSRITLRNAGIGFGETDRGQYETPRPTPYAHGAAMMVRRSVIDTAGMMPECYFLYYEELDWSLMITRKGYTIWYDPSCTIYHKESRSTGQHSPLRCYYITRNRLLFARRNVGRPTHCLTYLYLIIVYFRDLLTYLFQRRLDLMVATTRGILDFFRGRTGRRL